jgi:hypothetical protein
MQADLKRISLALAVLMWLGGCAAMSEAECRTGDWYGVGERDGRAGSPSRLGDYAQACAKTNILPDTAEYQRGRERGLLAYCTPENGYREGRNGHSYQNVCAPELDGRFLAAYQRGYERYRLDQRIATKVRRFDALQRDIDGYTERIAKAANDDERHRLIRERDSLQSARREVEIELIALRARQMMSRD